MWAEIAAEWRRNDGLEPFFIEPTKRSLALQQYDAVLVYLDSADSSKTFSDVSFGNVLADYADSGGGVVGPKVSRQRLDPQRP